MRRFKGHMDVLFIIVLGLLIVLALVAAQRMHKVSIISYDERIDLAIVLDNAGSGLLGLLNSGEMGLKYMEVSGSFVAGRIEDYDKVLEGSLESLRTGMKQMGYSMKVLVSGKEIKSYGEEPPKSATLVETDIPLPCSESTECRGRLKLGTW